MKTEKKYSYIFFDLDGTLTDPREGITKSVQYALKHMGILETDLKKLEPFIGPSKTWEGCGDSFFQTRVFCSENTSAF